MEVLDEKGRSIPFVMSPNERNFMDDIGGFSIVLKPQSKNLFISFRFLDQAIMSPEQKSCLDKCDGAMWDNGNEMVEPCSTLMHTVSFAIILIIALIQF